MRMIIFCNVGSLALGLAAWGTAVAAIRAKRSGQLLSVGSFACCCAALILQFLEIRIRVDHGDLSAVMDTIGATLTGAVVLTVVTVLLNLAACGRRALGGV